MSVGSEIRTTPFHKMHVDAGAKMVPFAGYEMPVSYPLGIKKEHIGRTGTTAWRDITIPNQDAWNVKLDNNFEGFCLYPQHQVQ